MRRLNCLMVFTALFACSCAKPPANPSTSSKPESVETLPATAPAAAAAADLAHLSKDLAPDDNYPLPELERDALLKYIHQLAEQKPRGSSQEAFVADQVSRAKSQLIAAEKIIHDPETETELLKAAIKAKLDTLRILAILEEGGIGASFQPYLARLEQDQRVSHQLLSRVSQLEFEMDRLGLGLATEPTELLQKVGSLLSANGIGKAEFLISQYAGITLDQMGFANEATTVLHDVAKKFTTAEDPQLAQEAHILLRQTRFRERVTAALEGGRAEYESLVKAVRSLLNDPPDLNLDHLDLTLNAAQVLEYSGKVSEGMEIYRLVDSAFAQADPKLAEQARRSLQYADKRANLIGNEVTIQGMHADGTPFDWNRFQDKVVLIQFWTTWSGPWHATLPELEATYREFHEAGFDIVGVNLDETLDQAYAFLRERNLPWTTVLDDRAVGFGNPNAVAYGVEAVPFAMLVGKDGKVADIHVHGDQLRDRIQALLQGSMRHTSRKAPNLK